ncbi:MAG: hypothetical protein QM820_25210 [Minicystis sp.]
MSAENAADRSVPSSRGTPASSRGGPVSSRGAPASGVVPVYHRGPMAPMVHERLVKALGVKRAGEVMQEALDRFEGRSVNTSQDMYDFAEILMKSGGLVQAVGRTIKVQALLRGAVER